MEKIDKEADSQEITMPSIYRYLENEEPTVEYILTKKECLEEAADKRRLGSFEAEGFWLLMSAGFE